MDCDSAAASRWIGGVWVGPSDVPDDELPRDNPDQRLADSARPNEEN